MWTGEWRSDYVDWRVEEGVCGLDFFNLGQCPVAEYVTRSNYLRVTLKVRETCLD